ncbi:MAG: GntR family transcriptional regulator [Enterovirga sp.]|jgi:DNA-binding GntR family transcriptional regulator|nr:GntR family transcriptional regulator [Enterovirga sp.]
MVSASRGTAEAGSGIDLRVLPRTVQQETVEKLRSAILAGIFKPGDRLVEVELCDRLGVSRPSVREAMRSLEAERLVSIIPNRGPHIPILTLQEAAEIYQVRALLEGEAAALCAERSTPADRRRMRNALGRFSKAVQSDDPEGRLASTSEFFEEILRVCGNTLIQEMLQSLHARINVLRARSMSFPGRSKLSLEEMSAILDAIETSDPAAARAAAVHHVQQAHSFAKAAYEADAK